jgi:hypothetical protein
MAQRKFWRKQSDSPVEAIMTRIATRPCPFRESEMLRQNGIPVLARLYGTRLTDPKSCRASWRP